MTQFLSIGECMIELAPRPDGTFSMGFAGDTFNTAWYARHLAPDTLRIGFLSAIGDDDASRKMAEFIKDAGIEPHLARRADRSVGLYMISLNNGERSFSYWRSAAAARSLADDLETLPLGAGDVAYFSGITLSILSPPARDRLLRILADAKGRGITVAFDPNLRPRLWEDDATMRDWTTRGGAVADIVLPSFEDEAAFFGDKDLAATAERYARTGAQTIFVKNGAGALLVRSAAGDEILTPEPIDPIVDTTAAGDSFNAGALVALLDGVAAPDAARAGCAVAAKVIGAPGALVAL